ncbi:MAG: acylase [Chitinophagaceae bacterium]|nr:MAG: acylase [Chitinophagaceae bacterium]
MKYFLLLAFLPFQLFSQSPAEIKRWEQQAERITIYRDAFGVPHIYGKTDADAVFGLLYAQCEDDFARVEMNYIEKLGRLAEIKGESKLYDDLLIRMLIDQDEAKKDYARAPVWLKKLCVAFADAVNFYLYKHPQLKPALLQRFEPWYPLLWTDGSIGAINTADISVAELKQFYSGETNTGLTKNIYEEKEMTGSNGFAFSPKITENGNAILYINPHVTFYFRPEVHMVSQEGLNAYGAVTWGQFFVYQGFNEHCGWMHTSSAVDAADVYFEKVTKKENKYFYLYEGRNQPVLQKEIVLQYKQPTGIVSKKIITYFTAHGPVMASRNNQWLSLKADNRIMNGLVQCWQRTKAKGLNDFKKTLDLKGNISNNTVYADAAGNIAYWHGNRIPKRDTAYDWSKPVDGTLKATQWKGYHPIDETVHKINPANGWLQNCNATPFTVAGIYSPQPKNYPPYMAPDGENFRGINAVRTLSETSVYNLNKVIAAGYDTRLAAFEVLVPALANAFAQTDDSVLSHSLKDAVAVLTGWNFRSSDTSIATSLAIEWGQELQPSIFAMPIPLTQPADQVSRFTYFARHAKAAQLLLPLQAAMINLQKKYGSWKISWGRINRFQRISPAIDNEFDDNKPSYPVGFASAVWGQLPSYSSRSFAGTLNRYGFNGNSFICAVEFGKRVKAKSLLAGGNSGNPASPHFFDQGDMYSKGHFKDVLFYKEDVLKQAKRSYHPGK